MTMWTSLGQECIRDNIRTSAKEILCCYELMKTAQNW